jgi:hypothetical protein
MRTPELRKVVWFLLLSAICSIRFLKIDTTCNRYVELSSDRAHDKVGHAIRDIIKQEHHNKKSSKQTRIPRAGRNSDAAQSMGERVMPDEITSSSSKMRTTTTSSSTSSTSRTSSIVRTEEGKDEKECCRKISLQQPYATVIGATSSKKTRFHRHEWEKYIFSFSDQVLQNMEDEGRRQVGRARENYI